MCNGKITQHTCRKVLLVKLVLGGEDWKRNWALICSACKVLEMTVKIVFIKIFILLLSSRFGFWVEDTNETKDGRQKNWVLLNSLWNISLKCIYGNDCLYLKWWRCKRRKHIVIGKHLVALAAQFSSNFL